jgi:hypothetical protein
LNFSYFQGAAQIRQCAEGCVKAACESSYVGWTMAAALSYREKRASGEEFVERLAGFWCLQEKNGYRLSGMGFAKVFSGAG